MKIVCDNCATKYSIADEKVRGKVFKIRCKKCSHIIVVRGTEGGDAPADAGDASYGEDQATVAAAGPGAGAPAGASADAVWHLVIDREQVGPMTAAEVRAKFAAGQVDAETYAWREGFADWLRLASIDDFRDLGGAGGGAAKAAPEQRTMMESKLPPEVAQLAGGDGSTRRTDTADIFASHQARGEDDGGAADLFGGKAGAAPASASFAAASSTGEDLFANAPTAANASPAAALFGAPAAEAPRARAASPSFSDGGGAAASASADTAGGGSKMTGQRNENSVLFSLNNLQALATGSGPSKAAAEPAPRPGYASSKTEGSGLIDIRAMAQQTLSAAPAPSSGDADIPSFSAAPVFSPVVAAPILMPTPQQGMPKWVWGVIGGGVLAVGGIAVLLVVMLNKKPAEPTVSPEVLAALKQASAAGNQLGAPPVAAGKAAAPTADNPAAAVKDNAPADKGDKPAADKEEAASKKGGRHEVKVASAAGSRHDKGSSKKDDPVAAVAAAPAAPAPEKKTRSAPKSDIDDLLEGAAPSRPAARAAAPAAAPADDPNLPDQLGRGDIVAGMNGIKGRVDGCSAQYHVPGTAMVSVVIGKNGRVSSASVQGALAGTPTGDCVARAVRGASFKKFKGSPMSINYPFILR